MSCNAPSIQASERLAASTFSNFAARSFYNEMREKGYTPKELLAVSIELIALVTHDLPERR